MHERADCLASDFVTVDEDLAREFEARLVESSTLAFRVAFSVLRQREDAEDVAQEAFAKAYRSFRTGFVPGWSEWRSAWRSIGNARTSGGWCVRG
jgi:DNA-directed RNA polymerase specialized sigma24 family protein